MDKFLPKNINKLLVLGPMSIDTQRINDFNPSYTLIIDGGINHLKRLGSLIHEVNSLNIGDDDSSKIKGKMDIELDTVKDLTDLAAGLYLLDSSKVSSIHLEGFTGGDFAHQLANIGEINAYLKRNLKIQSLTLDSLLIYNAGKHQIKLDRVFSIISLNQQHISLEGSVKYPLNKHRLEPFSSLGIHNEGDGFVDITCDEPLIII